MINPTALFRTLIIYAICVPMALILGYVLATPQARSTYGTVGIVVLFLALPLLLRYHHPLLLLGWNSTMIIFFLPGAPKVWLPLVALSLVISIFRRAIDQDYRPISVPSVAWPLVMLTAVVLVTGEMRGGIHFRSTGGEVYGGRNYILVLAAIAAYFALTFNRIPRERAKLYVVFFFVGGVTTLIGDALYFQTPALYWIYWFFPPNMGLLGGGQDLLRGSVARFGGLTNACMVLIYVMLAKYGIRGIFASQKPLRLAFFGVFCLATLLGGFRSNLVLLALVFSMQFYLEGMHRTRLLPVLVVGFLLMATIAVPFMDRMPFSIQRSFSFLPVNVDPMIRQDAEDSTEWRLKLWRAVLPQVREYLFLGKGYTFTPQDFDFSVNNLMGRMKAFSEDQSWAALVGDFHNGPLSLTIPFGIWGDIAFLWFVLAAFRVLYNNYRYGDPDLLIMNKFLFALFTARVVFFFFVFGAFYNDIATMVAYVGLSISLNWGVCGPKQETAPEASEERAVGTMLPIPTRFAGPRFRR